MTTTGTLTIASSTSVTYDFGSITNNSTYGQTAQGNLGSPTLNGIASGDLSGITAIIGLYQGNTQMWAGSMADAVSLLAKLGAGNYTEKVVSLTGGSSSLYAITDSGSHTGTLTIGKATLSIASQGSVGATKVYDGTTNANITDNGTLGSGVLSGDTVQLALNASYDDKNVGANKSVTGGYTLSGASSANYQLADSTFASTTAAITPKTLTIATAGTVVDKNYDGSNAASVGGNGTLGGVVAGDTVTLALGGTTFADKNAGSGKTVSGTYTLSGAGAGNYQLDSSGRDNGVVQPAPPPSTRRP